MAAFPLANRAFLAVLIRDRIALESADFLDELSLRQAFFNPVDSHYRNTSASKTSFKVIDRQKRRRGRRMSDMSVQFYTIGKMCLQEQ